MGIWCAQPQESGFNDAKGKKWNNCRYVLSLYSATSPVPRSVIIGHPRAKPSEVSGESPLGRDVLSVENSSELLHIEYTGSKGTGNLTQRGSLVQRKMSLEDQGLEEQLCFLDFLERVGRTTN